MYKGVARMAELADASDSKSDSLAGVRVRPPLRAPFFSDLVGFFRNFWRVYNKPFHLVIRLYRGLYTVEEF